MATCHSLRVIGDEMVGDPLDVKMFEFTGWSFEETGQISSTPGPEETMFHVQWRDPHLDMNTVSMSPLQLYR